jgi:ferric-dicitrate binding protein FerR (iron transport regulator)
VDCEQALAQFFNAMDRELDPAVRVPLEAHLRACAGCRAATERYRVQDADLRRLFAPRRRAAASVANQVIAELRRSSARSFTWNRWLPLLAAAAAGFLLAVVLFQPWKKPGEIRLAADKPEQSGLTIAPAPQPGIVLALISGATQGVEVLMPGTTSWQPLPRGGEISPTSRVRTAAEARCEFATSDGSEVRLNSGTEVCFVSGRKIELSRGQMLARVAKAAVPFRVAVSDATVTALGTEFDILCRRNESVLTVLEGATKVTGKGKEETVLHGEAATIVNGDILKREAQHLVQATSWVNELLILKGRHNQELTERVDAILDDIYAQIGNLKMEQHFTDDELRRLGDHCVLPLTRYIQSQRSRAPGDHRKRVGAARVLADLAQPWSIADLIQLLGDKDREVRFYAAKGLQRLTQQTFDRQPEEWRDRSLEELQESRQKAQKWWQENKHRYPPVP